MVVKIYFQLYELGDFAKFNLDLEFLVCILGGGYNGWTVAEMQTVYRRWCEDSPPPSNVLLRKE